MLDRSLGRVALWIGIYLLLVALPLLVLLTGPAGAGFWWDFSMALGFAGMAMLGVQFALTARFRRAAAPFGIDIVYYFHRYAALVPLGLVLAHFLVIRIDNVAALGAIDPRQAHWYMTAGRVALVLFLVVVTSLWRKPLRIDYERWRLWHALLATTAFLAAARHIEGVGHYINAPWKRTLWTAYTLSWVGLIVHVRLVKPWTMLRRPWQVTEVRPERGNAWTLALAPVGHAGLRFAPGQFGWLTLGDSPFHARNLGAHHRGGERNAGDPVGAAFRLVAESGRHDIVYRRARRTVTADGVWPRRLSGARLRLVSCHRRGRQPALPAGRRRRPA